MPIKEAVKIYKDQLKSSLDSLTKKKSDFQKKEQQQKEKISGVRKLSHSIQTHITSQFAELRRIITEKEQSLLRDLRKEKVIASRRGFLRPGRQTRGRHSTKVRMDTDPNSAISAFLSNCEDHHLFRLTRFYTERLEQAIEEGVEGVGFMLTHDHHFNEREYHSVTELAEKGNRAGASKLLLDLVMEKGTGARRVMWESFVKLHHHLPKLSRILNEIRERGDGQFACMDTERCLSELPARLKEMNRSAPFYRDQLPADVVTMSAPHSLMHRQHNVVGN
ncbi:uncharacterized protein [Hemitrygon akajei]|uniref:uncharacterized protein n=1 Tax=Hemitrygon akajei TaxID=2704970 RepID=UPI003BF9A877